VHGHRLGNGAPPALSLLVHFTSDADAEDCSCSRIAELERAVLQSQLLRVLDGRHLGVAAVVSLGRKPASRPPVLFDLVL